MVDFDNTQQQHGMEANREQSVDSRAETHFLLCILTVKLFGEQDDDRAYIITAATTEEMLPIFGCKNMMWSLTINSV